MKINSFLLVIALCSGLYLNASHNEQREIQEQVNMILEWAKKEKELIGEENFNKKRDTSQILNPISENTQITREAKKIAKAQLFPESQPKKAEEPTRSYWPMYTSQFIQDTASTTSDYIASWIPKRIKNAVNKMSTKTKIALATAIIGSLTLYYNKETLIKMIFSNQTPQQPFLSEEEKKKLGINPTINILRKDIINNPKRLEQLQEISRPYVSVLEKLNQPLQSSIDEKKAQEIANAIIATVTSDDLHHFPLAGFGIIDASRKGSIDRDRDESGNVIGGFAKNYAPTVTERARFEALRRLKEEHPEYVELGMVERYLRKDNEKGKIYRTINSELEK